MGIFFKTIVFIQNITVFCVDAIRTTKRIVEIAKLLHRRACEKSAYYIT